MSSLTSSTNSGKCTKFRPHHLRPDKCRNCFDIESRHPQLQLEAQVQEDETQQATSARKQQLNQINDRSKEELLADLRQCHEDRDRLRNNGTVLMKEKDQLIENYKQEIEQLKCKLVMDGDEVGRAKGDDGQLEGELERLRNELQMARDKIEMVESQRDRVSHELRTIESEMEEMHDNFKEEESEQFEQLKQELDLATKNCKILQIRLNKSERQYGQLEQVKSMLESQLEEWNNRSGGLINHHPHEADSSSSSSLLNADGSGFAQCGDDFVKISSREYDQLLRDLNDTIERERDLQEQIKYSQEEAQMKSDRLQAVEAENEVLLSKVNKLTLANSRLRSNPMRSLSKDLSLDGGDQNKLGSQQQNQQHQQQQQQQVAAAAADCDLIQQTEQLKLALDLVQSENERLRHKCQESIALAEASEGALKECESRMAQLEQELVATGNGSTDASRTGQLGDKNKLSRASSGETTLAKLELECRHLRTRLVHSERECKQLKAELSTAGKTEHRNQSAAPQPRLGHSLSMDGGSSSSSGGLPSGEQAKLREIVRQLREECNSLMVQNKDLEGKLEHLGTNQNVGGTKMESDLLEKLKNQLEVSEQELAKTKSRLVELDLEHTKLQRLHKRLVETPQIAQGGGGGTGNDKSPAFGRSKVAARRVKLPPEQQRDSMGRQELRQALKDLEAEADELANRLAASESMLDELREQQQQQQQPVGSSTAGANDTGEAREQVKTLRRLLDQERLLSSNLKLDVANLEQIKLELQTNVQMLERERVAMEEELDKMRQVNAELDLNLEETKRNYRSVNGRLRDVQASNEKLRHELAQLKSTSTTTLTSGSTTNTGSDNLDTLESVGKSVDGAPPPPKSSPGDMLLLMRDLSELKVKNGFLMRQLEIAREDTGRQLDDLRQAHELQQRRAVELAQLELKERHLAEGQQLRDELNDFKQRLAGSQRQATRNEEEASGERDRLRSIERDWRRDKSQWQQRLEQLEAQLTIEHRSNEYKSKEWESLVRDKERELISVQDKYVQLERDMKRLHNKFNLLEESSESKQKNLLRDLEIKKRELSELIESSQRREDEYYENCKRFNNERATLMETLEPLKRSYDEKLIELKSSRELLALRQEQSYKERQSAQEQLEQLGDQLLRMSEHEGQVKLLRQQLQTNERHLESVKREHGQLKEERTRLKSKCEELERRCHRYEKQELIAKTSHISSSSATNFLRNPFQSQQHHPKHQQSTTSGGSRKTQAAASDSTSGGGAAADDDNGDNGESQDLGGKSNGQYEMDSSQSCMMVEKLTSKINDQRHLINMLKQQNEALQLEVKQLRLIQSSDKIRWQGRVNQLQSRLNSCEEKLLFESQLLNRDTHETARRKLEVQWAEERQMSLDTIQQQQAHNDQLARDLKKLGQAHEMLRLQTKQLESHNNKLSRRLIEYQQQQLHVASSNNKNQELEVCLSRQDLLLKQNIRLVKLMKEEAKPLIETVTKIVTSLDVSEPLKPLKQQQSEEADTTPSSSETTKLVTDPLASALNSSSSSSSNPASRPISTHRPLVTPGGGTLERKAPDLINTATKLAPKSQSPSRFARLLGKQPKITTNTNPQSEQQEAVGQDSLNKSSSSGSKTTTKTVKRVRVKSSAIGITLAEKKQLKRHLEQLSLAMENLDAELELTCSSEQQPAPTAQSVARGQRASSSPPVPPVLVTGSRAERPHSFSQRDSDSGSAAPSRVHWQLQGDSSDLDSNKSWSGAGGGGKVNQQQQATTNIYRRFPQSTPASYGASLTDYESESSLASYDDLSTTYSPSSRRFTSGAESDSCIGQGQHQTGSGKLKVGPKKRTLKTRLTSTLRNISRSITGLASDSETESVEATGSYKRALSSERGRLIKGHQRQLVAGDDDNQSNDADHEGTMREIRV